MLVGRTGVSGAHVGPLPSISNGDTGSVTIRINFKTMLAAAVALSSCKKDSVDPTDSHLISNQKSDPNSIAAPIPPKGK